MVEMKDNEQRVKDVQQRYAELQMLERQIKQVQGQIEQVEGQIGEIEYVQQSLRDLKDVGVGSELFVPLSSGIFVKAELKDNAFVLVNVGAGAVVKKSIEEASEILEHQAIELRTLEEERAMKGEELSGQFEKTQKQLVTLVGDDV